MNVFLPYPSFAHSVAVLDRARLGKQRVECSQMLSALGERRVGVRSGWSNHPAVDMWLGHESALAVYYTMCVNEWEARGYTNNMMLPYRRDWTRVPGYPGELEADARLAVVPSWVGDEKVHASHRSNLLRKDPEHYGALGWAEPPDLPYVWPKI